MHRSLRLARAGVVIGAFASMALAPAASADLDEVNTKKLREGVTVNGILQHERALQTISNMNGGTRASGTAGYRASLNYVKDRLTKAGYTVKQQAFNFPFYRELAPAELSQVSPAAQDYETATFDYSGTGDVTGRLVPVNDNQIPPGAEPSSSNAGCEPGDFTPASASQPEIALIQRGTCDFRVKAENAVGRGLRRGGHLQPGHEPGRHELRRPARSARSSRSRSSATLVRGRRCARRGRLRGRRASMHVVTPTENVPEATTWNLIAETKKGAKDQQVVVGAHLDSVPDGPGHQRQRLRHGVRSSSSPMQMAKPRHQAAAARCVRLLGRRGGRPARLDALRASSSAPGVADVDANLNFDMLASPNHARFVYDGDFSDSAPTRRRTSTRARRRSRGCSTATSPRRASRPSRPPSTAARTTGPFHGHGVPAGGLFSGRRGARRPPEQAAVGRHRRRSRSTRATTRPATTSTTSTLKALNEMSDAAVDVDATLRAGPAARAASSRTAAESGAAKVEPNRSGELAREALEPLVRSADAVEGRPPGRPSCV